MMDVQQLRALLERFEFNAPMPMRFYINHVSARSANVVIAMTTRPRGSDRDAPPSTVNMLFGVALEHEDEEMVCRKLRDTARALWLHEFHEWFRCDGKLVYDPHANHVIYHPDSMKYGDGV